jgi:Flp pilus assembly protein TadD
MTELLIGIFTLGGLVALQMGMRHRSQRRMAEAWEQAQAELARGNHEAGVAHLEACIHIMPLWLPPRFLLGALFTKLGRLKEAEEQLKFAQALQPREAEGLLELGIFYITAASRIEEGVALLREAIACDAAAAHRIQSDPRLRAFRDSSDVALLEQS